MKRNRSHDSIRRANLSVF